MDNKRTIAVLLILVLAFSGCMLALSIREAPQPISESCSLSFDGVDDYALVNYDSSWASIGEGDFSVAVWIRTTQTAVGEYMIIRADYEGGSPRRIFGLKLFSGGASFETYDDGYHYTPEYSFIANGQWHFLVGVRDGLIQYLYDNGSLASDVTCDEINNVTIASGGHIALGRYEATASGYYTGELYGFHLYGRALSPNEVKSMYDLKEYTNVTSLLVSLPMDEGSGSTVYDSSGFFNNAQAIGASWIWERTYPVEPEYNPYQAFTSNAPAFIFLVVGIAIVIYVIIKVSREEFP